MTDCADCLKKRTLEECLKCAAWSPLPSGCSARCYQRFIVEAQTPEGKKLLEDFARRFPPTETNAPPEPKPEPKAPQAKPDLK